MSQKKEPLTLEELTAKLDRELDDYIENLERKPYTEGWPEDRWQEEMEKHPFFMTQNPDPSNMSPLMEGLQQLKYSPEYNDPKELAQSYKEDGNFNYKHKKYRQAILCFSKALAVGKDSLLSEPKDHDLLAQLYSNRALAHLKLQNYRSSLNDCKEALKVKPDYVKALFTAAKCCFGISNYSQCIDYCDTVIDILRNNNEDCTEIATLRTNAVKSKKILERETRLKNMKSEKESEKRKKILKAIEDRRIKMDTFNVFDKTPHVNLDEDGYLSWPVIFAYPEYQQTDLVESFNESTTISTMLEEIFQEPPAWDVNSQYKIESLNVYYQGSDEKMHKVNVAHELGSVLQAKNLIVKDGTPIFFVLVAGSKAEKNFLTNGC